MGARSRWRVGGLAPVVVLFAGCHALPPGTIRHPADLQDGRLVICRLEYGSDRPYELRPHLAAHDYAILIDWRDEACVPRLFVYDRGRRHVDETRSFETLLELVGRLPHGFPVAWIDTCCAPISYGMGPENEARLRAVLARGERTLLTAGVGVDSAGHDNGRVICTCEALRMYLPGDAVAAKGTGASCNAQSPE